MSDQIIPDSDQSDLPRLSDITTAVLCPPFEWCHVPGGTVSLENAAVRGGTQGGIYQVTGFAIAKYPVTNGQYQRFIDHPDGFANPQWWEYSEQAAQWHRDHPRPKPSAFPSPDLPRIRLSWFDALAFCLWLSAELHFGDELQPRPGLDAHNLAGWRVRLPTEQEWQRAALGDSGWVYPWGDQLDERRANFARQVGSPTRVGSYPEGANPFGALDMVGNVWEWCLTPWGVDSEDLSGYTYRFIRGGAWNVSNPEYLRPADRAGNSPRGQLNDAGFRCALLCLRPALK